MITAGINGPKASKILPISTTIMNIEQKKTVSMQ